MSDGRTKSGNLRMRWAAIGAAIAITLGGTGAARWASAADSDPSAVVAIDPTRILDSRPDSSFSTNVGLSGPFNVGQSRKLQVTGSIPTLDGPRTVVPVGAAGVILNVTAVGPTQAGFVSVRPGTASGTPTTSNLNVVPGGTVPNSVTVQLPASGGSAGQLDIFYGAGAPGTTDIIVDVVGYLTEITGPDQIEPSNIVTVAKSNGDFTSIQAAIDSIDDEAFDNPYLVTVAPGQYFEQITMAQFIDVQGAGRDVTAIVGSGTAQGLAIDATVTGAPGTTLSDISVSDETSVGNNVQAVSMFADGVGAFTMRNVEIDAIADNASLSTGGLRTSGTVTVQMFDVSINAKGPAASPILATVSSSIIGSEVTVLNNGTGSTNALTSQGDGDISVNDATILGSAVAFGTGSIRIVDSEMDGLGFAGTSCHNTTDAEFRDLSENCQLRDRDLMWAKVDAGTSTIAVLDSDGVDLNPVLPNPAARIGVGLYTVKFDRSIVGCAWTATSNDNDAGAVTPRILAVERNTGADEFTLRVRSSDFDGVPADTAEDDGFTVVVHCVDRVQAVG